MAYVNDAYDLNYSSPITITGSEENTTSLQLEESSSLPLELFGYVYNTTKGGSVIANAFVTVFDESENVVTNTYTDGSGYYSITTLSEGSYQINASGSGFTPSDLIDVTIADTPVQQDVVLQPYSDEDRVIYGIITDSDTDAISDARIDIVDSTSGLVVASTTSIGDGEYSVYNLVNGDYTIIATASGYSAKSGTATISDETPFIEVGLSLTSYTTPEEGATISGFITNAIGDPIDKAWVGLYSDPATSETLVATTTTNSSGFYIFEDVLPGSYVVKAKA